MQLLAFRDFHDASKNLCFRDLLMEAVKRDGDFLRFGTPELRAGKAIVLAAVRTTPSALKFSMGLSQDCEILKAAGIWDEQACSRKYQITLSVKFSLAEQSTPYATEFALEMKKNDYLGQFKTYNPNVWDKNLCDPEFTDMDHPCRGSLMTCLIPEHQNLTADTKKPCATSCWRFAFRFHMEECKASNGFLIQVEEKDGLGAGQKIETEMAKEVGIKVFRTYTTNDKMDERRLRERLAQRVQAWYDSGCENMDLENIYLAYDNDNPRGTRPDFEPDRSKW